MQVKVKIKQPRLPYKAILFIKTRCMKTSILKPVIAGMLIGAGLFFIPFFIIRVVLFILIVGLFVRLFIRPRRFGAGFHQRRFAYADHLRSMSDEEYVQFKQRAQQGCGPFEKPHSKNNQNAQ